MNRTKLILAAAFTAMGGALLAPLVLAQTQPAPPADCVYAEYRTSSGACAGATTRLCQGPSTCPRS